ncbi:tRNA synthetases class I (M)-domain-containing protein [Nemania sp. FL0916]|nr:tRNA synthetases class I (M)-domain-containing protein [Nemania sp. FL0916]
MDRFLVASSRRLLTLRTAPIRYNGWTCRVGAGVGAKLHPRLRHGWISAQMRFNSTNSATSNSEKAPQQPEDKPYYVTTPIFYVNASPHVGHLYSMVMADVLTRWQKLKGRAVFLSTGTDEHGMKVQRAAQLQDLAPKALCDANAETFRDLANKADIAHDRFIRTTDPEHRDAVEHFWARLLESGHVYESSHEGWYCVSDETFYPASAVEKRVSPLTGKTFTASVETGNAVEWTVEKNYHFRLTAFRDRLLQFYRANPAWVVPSTRFAEVVDWVENNLTDLSISRPASRLDWGIPVPDDPHQTIYVWLDALVNYITTTGYPNWQSAAVAAGTEQQHTGCWPADVHVVGKDIIRFHCIYWPAFLMALDLPLPKQVLSHGHWLMSKQKMSKSVGNVVNPFFALDRWGVDTMRYYLIIAGNVSGDADYDNAIIVERYKKGLQGGLGNLLNRATRPSNWSVREAVQAMTKTQPPSLLLRVEEHQEFVRKAVPKVDNQMKALNSSAALQTIMEIVFETNRFFSEMEPWATSKNGDLTTTQQTVFLTTESLRIVGILLQPFMPEKAPELLDRLGVEPDKRSFQDATLYTDTSYGTPLVPLGTGATNSLFPQLPVED